MVTLFIIGRHSAILYEIIVVEHSQAVLNNNMVVCCDDDAGAAFDSLSTATKFKVKCKQVSNSVFEQTK